MELGEIVMIAGLAYWEAILLIIYGMAKNDSRGRFNA